jgi:hypothetical protein
MLSNFAPTITRWFRFSVSGVFLVAGLAPLPALASQVWQFSLVGDMYKEGKDLSHPTPEKPVFYYPIVVGYTQMGARVAGTPETPPTKKEIVHDLALALLAQGYRATQEVEVPAKAVRPGEKMPATTKALSPPPSLLLVLSWGSLRAQKLESGDVTDASPPPVANQNQMIGLIAGKNFDSIVDFGQRAEDVWEGVQDDRYFVMVSAYDFDAYFQHHKKVVLWVAKMSVPTSGTTMADVMPALIKTGAPLFGHETIGPKVMDVPNAPEGKVEVGTPTVVGH